ncbi:hypothetical protein F3N42_01040 [Marinihelvus fidelis]|uniref:Uncharacterized protein n=1 Tax=Marinihelvus fidelis TaxID=2613842 RepID=A0A5N0TGI0_9GAMM|nr:hypothetical protein [Marinihelvus fidelis]KAA9134160.1 hypothetical protein F3N42_01040 [Marinihelvus fidelis]
MKLFKLVRILLLLLVLVAVASNQFLGQARLASWERTLWVTVYPIAADGQAVTRSYIDALRPEQFDEISTFIGQQARRHGVPLADPVHVQLAPRVDSLPPPPPTDGNRFSVAVWSLKMRWWAWRNGRVDGLPSADVRLFVKYQAARNGVVLDASLGMRKGRYGVVNAFASNGQAAMNRVVIVHELLHVLGATDKYELYSGQPIPPDGLANPLQDPLYPQRRAEIMGARIAESPFRARMPSSLGQCVIGVATANEIGWVD